MMVEIFLEASTDNLIATALCLNVTSSYITVSSTCIIQLLPCIKSAFKKTFVK